MANYTYDQPGSQGAANVLKRARQFTELRWTPIEKMPRTAFIESKENDKEPVSYYRPWYPNFGLPYSSARIEEKFIGYNVSLETFYTALANPKSVLYTRSLLGGGKRMSSWYGMVCSVFGSWCLALPSRRVAKLWGNYPDMEKIDVQSPQDIQLCDILDNPAHVAIVTGIKRDESGNVVAVTVTECTRPQNIALENTAEEFQRHWLDHYGVYRYKYLDDVPYEPSPYIHLEGDPELPVPVPNRTLLPDYGNRANYRLGETVELNIMEEGWESVVVEYDGEVKTIAAAEPGIVAYAPGKPGLYRFWCVAGERVSEAVEAAVTELKLSCTKAEDGTLTVHFALDGDDALVGCYVARADDRFMARSIEFTNGEKGSADVVIAGLEPTRYQIKGIAANAFGQYSARSIEVEV